MLASRQLARSFGIVSQRRAGGAARLFAAKADAPDPLEVRVVSFLIFTTRMRSVECFVVDDDRQRQTI